MGAIIRFVVPSTIGRAIGRLSSTINRLEAIALLMLLTPCLGSLGALVTSQGTTTPPSGITTDGLIATPLFSMSGVGRLAAGQLEFEVTVADGEADWNAAPPQDPSWPLHQIGADIAISKNVTGQSVRIAVIDTGIDYNNPDLKHSYRGGYDFVNNDDDPYDDNGHGTFVAGVIAGTIDGRKGSLGAAPDIEIYAVKVIGADGRGSVRNIVSGVQWAIDHGVQIICMSLSILRDDPALRGKLDEAYGRGILLVAAAGNTGGKVTYPARYETVIAVGSVDRDDQAAKNSATGPEVEVVAPGVKIISTVPGGRYAVRSGTSYAAGYATGSLALLISAHPDLDGEGVRGLLREGAVDLGAPGRDSQYGYGLVNVAEKV